MGRFIVHYGRSSSSLMKSLEHKMTISSELRGDIAISSNLVSQSKICPPPLRKTKDKKKELQKQTSMWLPSTVPSNKPNKGSRDVTCHHVPSILA